MRSTELNWYDHKPNPVCESERYKLLWDFKVQTDRHIGHNKPDIVLLNREEKAAFLSTLPALSIPG